MPLLEAHRVFHSYALDRHRVQALRNVDLAIRPGEFVALSGPSGSGKTTLLNLLGLLEGPEEGHVLFDGRDPARMSEAQRTALRRERIGFIFQAFNLIPVLTAYENVEYFLLKTGVPPAEVGPRVTRALEAVGVGEQAVQRPGQMSGGQRQRVAIARALVREADVILADEPTAALDAANVAAVMRLLKSLNRERGVTCVFATHDPRVLREADRTVTLVDGEIAS